MNATDAGTDPTAACDVEPITRLEQIQSFGFLIAMSRDWTVIRASANLEAFLGVDAHTALGMSLDSLADRDALHDIRNRLLALMSGGTERLYGVLFVKGRSLLDIAIHYVGDICVLEGELAGLDSRTDAASLVRTMMARLNRQSTLDAYHRDATRQIRAITGFDRVMIYRFAENGSGEVIAETATAESQSYLSLHFPASDIPLQARALYLRNPFRIIADVHSATVPLMPAAANAADQLDLSLAITRAVSTTHIEYLRNMDVAASLSISIILDGALWGLITCHSKTPRCPSFAVRTAAELFGQMYSMTLESRIRHASDNEDRQSLESVDRIVQAIADDEERLTHAGWLHDAMRQVIACDGIATYQDGRLFSSGSTPSAPDIETIARVLDRASANRVFATDHLASMLPGALAHVDHAGGVLSIPISRVPRDYLLLFRRERHHEIIWAGNPDKAVGCNADSARLSPRKSFAAYSESVRGRSDPFTRSEMHLAETLRSGLIEGILRGSYNADEARKRSAERQELLIAELNHRVRNVLALIRGLISQTQGEDGDVASYVRSLNGRVQALARAHDRVTQQNWGPGPLTAIFEDEIGAHVPTRRERFMIRGARVLLQPQAFSTCALIIHELVTNSAKYGALSGSGRVDVFLDLTPDGLDFKWREIDGPPVKPPTRRGFGSVIIERVVPFDLQGTATIRYLPAGLEADFFIPERHLALTLVPAKGSGMPMLAEVGPQPTIATNLRPLEALSVLLLEDNLIVALEAEDLLKDLGAVSVWTASTIEAAAQVLERERPDFAVLDINIGFETSLGFANRLRDLGIPFVFASGYGESSDLKGLDSAVLAVSKPYDRDHFGVAIAETLTRFKTSTQSLAGGTGQR
jgi:light-regulated signal transduction histidine kinase (bacteriophytochrome)